MCVCGPGPVTPGLFQRPCNGVNEYLVFLAVISSHVGSLKAFLSPMSLTSTDQRYMYVDCGIIRAPSLMAVMGRSVGLYTGRGI